MSLKFTPGPWEIAPWGKGESTIIARLNGKTSHVTMTAVDADARLIAAAPDLYEAVRLFVEEYDDGSDDGVNIMLAYVRALTAGKAALAKARGDA